MTSAKGLFRATGNRRKVRAVGLPLGPGGAPITDEGERAREANDFYPTPKEATWALMAAERLALARYPVIWESACGDWAMARELEAGGHRVIGSDLIDRGVDAEKGVILRDYFAFTEAPARAMVTNPPFALASAAARYAWMRHGWETLGLDYMALLLPLSWLGPAELAATWTRMPPARVHVMDWKVDFTGERAPPSYFIWAVWDRAVTVHGAGTLLKRVSRPGVPPTQIALFAPRAGEGGGA